MMKRLYGVMFELKIISRPMIAFQKVWHCLESVMLCSICQRVLISIRLQVQIELEKEQLQTRLKQDGAANQSYAAQCNQLSVALKASEEVIRKEQASSYI